MIDVGLAFFAPFLLMVVVTRITFSLLGACIVTFMVLFVVLDSHAQPWPIMILTLLSFAGGFAVAKKRLKRIQGM